MQKMMTTVLVVAVLALGAGHVFAHEDFRVIGPSPAMVEAVRRLSGAHLQIRTEKVHGV